MSDELMEEKKAVCVLDPFCPSCRSHQPSGPYWVSVDSIEAQDTGWVLQGAGKPEQLRVKCLSCGQMYEIIRYIIPIECASFPCPKCGQLQDLEYKVQHIQAGKDSFQFEAKITCRKCANTKSFKEVLKKILEVLKITVGPTGVTVSKA